MENVKIAKICGMCAGCKRAISTVLNSLETEKNVCLFKELVHNERVMNNLKAKGVKVKHELEELTPDDFVVLRAHGEPAACYEYLESRGIRYVDCACINVQNIHKKVQNYSNLGYKIIIIGKYGKNSGKMHPEITGTIGWCTQPPILIEDEDDVEKLSGLKNENFYRVCQTTFNLPLAKQLVKKIEAVCEKTHSQIVINLSICNSQQQINESSTQLAQTCDVLFVVGSKASSNTTELYNNLSKLKPTVFLEDTSRWREMLKAAGIALSNTLKIGITAGASADPEELIVLKQNIEKAILEEL